MQDEPSNLSEDQRKRLYWSMLRGVAKVAQDHLCAEDKQHDWSPWHRTQIRHDVPLVPVRPEDTPAAMNRVVRTKSQRHCYNCGKEQTDAG